MIPPKPFTFERARERQEKLLDISNEKAEVHRSTADDAKTVLVEEQWRHGDNVALTEFSSNNYHVHHLKSSKISLCTDKLFCVKVSDVYESEVFCGPTRGSIFVENCDDCVFEFCCAQLRVHNCRNCTFKIWVKSEPIIEDCTKLGFSGQYPVNKYEDLSKQAEKLGFVKNENHKKVHDFNALLESKNFFVLD